MRPQEAITASGRSGRSAPALVVAGLVVAGALIMGVRFTTTEIGTHPSVTLPEPNGQPVALVIGRHQSGGFSVFGFELGTVTRTIDVQFYVPPECRGLVTTGDAWPAPHPECAVPVAVVGTVSGGGHAASGDGIVAVSFDVDRACFEAITPGDDWPPPDGCGAPAAG